MSWDLPDSDIKDHEPNRNGGVGKAVLVGISIEFAGAFATKVLAMLVSGLYLILAGESQETVAEAVSQVLQPQLSIPHIGAITLGLLFSFAAGYMTVYTTKGQDRLPLTLLILIVFSVGSLFRLASGPVANLAVGLLVGCFQYLGGRYAERRVK